MKKYILLPLMLMATACLNDIKYSPKDIEPKIVINSIMSTGDTVHRVFVSISNHKNVLPPESGKLSLRVTVNGEPVSSAEKKDPYGRVKTFKEFQFKAELGPGDKIGIVADYGRLQASAECTALQPASISKADTLSGKTVIEGENKDVMRFRVRLKDRQGEKNWYRITMGRKNEAFLDNEGEKLSESETLINIIGKEDYLLDDGTANETNDLFWMTSPNKYKVFNDSQFADSEYDMKIMALTSDIMGSSFDKFPSYDEFYLHTHININLMSIDEMTFKYLKELSALTSDDYDTFLMEAINLEQNVKGGLGFVSIATPYTFTVTLPVRKFKSILYNPH